MKVSDFIGQRAKYDDLGDGYIWGETKRDGLQMIAEVRGWGAIQNLFKTENEAAKFQDEVGHWIADAINQKLTKERAEACPVCQGKRSVLCSACGNRSTLGIVVSSLGTGLTSSRPTEEPERGLTIINMRKHEMEQLPLTRAERRKQQRRKK
jgi:hypothetical protein